ncbi:hypothetical protein [Corynebacterium dentalis]|uniref:hypothetical protein n=1 Tax=Corynebacterium dentalis TaxID=2014528 RepID=UPI0028A23A4B|nr:hypothetical protein [Corynebacterium dentalis]
MTLRKISFRSGLAATLLGATVFTAAPAIAAPTAEAPAQADETQGNEAQGKDVLDLKPEIRVAAGKVPGYAGLVSISATNVGNTTYYQEFPLTTFRIEVKTAQGPKGVDRLITPGWFNGAYTRDLGFDRATSTRTFETTLSNPIREGDGKLIANLNFGDGKTDRGRLVNYIKVTQVGRPEADTSTHNDQNVDSRDVTLTDGGRPNAGLF